MKLSLTRFLPLIFILFLLQACGDGSTGYYNVEYTPPEPYDLSTAVSDTTTADGLKIYVIEEGSGRDTLMLRDQAVVRYTGRIKENGDVFDSTFRNDGTQPTVLQNLTPFPKQTGSRRIDPLVEGFRRGIIQEYPKNDEKRSDLLSGMRPGEKRVLIIPPELGYGKKEDNDTGHQLQDKTLRFDVELVGIR